MKNIIIQFFKSFTKKGIERQRVMLIQSKCKHAEWNMDKQIRVIECKGCGLRGWVEDYVDLFNNR